MIFQYIFQVLSSHQYAHQPILAFGQSGGSKEKRAEEKKRKGKKGGKKKEKKKKRRKRREIDLKIFK